MNNPVNSAELPAGYGPRHPTQSGSRGGGKLAVIGALAFALGSVVLLGLYFNASRKAPPPAPAPAVTPTANPAARAANGDTAALRKAVDRYLDEKIALTFDGKSFETTWRDLGLGVDEALLAQEAAKAGGAVPVEHYLGGKRTVPVALDAKRALEVLVGYKDQYDRPAADARMDLSNRKVLPEQEGYGINVYASLAGLEETARHGGAKAELAGGKVMPQVTREKLGNVDISHVMGWFETKYPPVEKDRNYNLKVAAEKVNGKILMPGEEFSFNQTVGDRTEKEGYRVAHVITAGEMVDGLAGGTCQVSSTLHGAAWFAGLDIVFSRPHSRPSAYVTMGLDATVVYPTTDLKLKNPYDFPVVFRYVVSQGTMRVEILGQQRPWDKVAFEREIKKETPYQTITREDDTLPVGSMVVEQIGFPGYELIRRRIFIKDGVEKKVEKWNIKYPPTTEYIRVGTNMNPNLAPPKEGKHHGIKPPEGRDKKWRLYQ